MERAFAFALRERDFGIPEKKKMRQLGLYVLRLESQLFHLSVERKIPDIVQFSAEAKTELRQEFLS